VGLGLTVAPGIWYLIQDSLTEQKQDNADGKIEVGKVITPKWSSNHISARYDNS